MIVHCEQEFTATSVWMWVNVCEIYWESICIHHKTLRVTMKFIDNGIIVITKSMTTKRTFVCLWWFNRSGPQARPGGGVINGHQVYQWGVSERPGFSGQRLSCWGHSPQSPATLPLLSTWTLLEVKHPSAAAFFFICYIFTVCSCEIPLIFTLIPIKYPTKVTSETTWAFVWEAENISLFHLMLCLKLTFENHSEH